MKFKYLNRISLLTDRGQGKFFKKGLKERKGKLVFKKRKQKVVFYWLNAFTKYFIIKLLQTQQK